MFALGRATFLGRFSNIAARQVGRHAFAALSGTASAVWSRAQKIDCIYLKRSPSGDWFMICFTW